MWKIALAFIVFAGLGLYMLMKPGAEVDMGGEKVGGETHEAAPAESAASAPAAPVAASAASAG
ncbi:MAG: hypothetical protein AB9M60_18935 [Leptothrix sp. (in: b-proteobacteria)]